MEPILCVKGCGFYASAETRNMCSTCYKNFIKSKIIEQSTIAVDHHHHDHKSSSSQSDAEILETTLKMESLTLKEKKRNRCKSCNKKVGLLGFRCRCEELFCGLHRMPEVHSCDFDYKSTNSYNPHLTLLKADKLNYRA